MHCCLRWGRLWVCFLFCTVMLAQENRSYGYGGGYDPGNNHRECDHHRPHTSPIDYLLLPGFPGARAAAAFALTPNEVFAMPFHLDRFFRVRHVGLSIFAAQPGSHAYAGIYDARGNLLVQGKFPTDAAGDFTVDADHAVTLKPGTYYFAIGGEDVVSQGVGYLFDEGPITLLGAGVAANQIADGSLPATLGAVTPPVEESTPYAVFKP